MTLQDPADMDMLMSDVLRVCPNVTATIYVGAQCPPDAVLFPIAVPAKFDQLVNVTPQEIECAAADIVRKIEDTHKTRAFTRFVTHNAGVLAQLRKFVVIGTILVKVNVHNVVANPFAAFTIEWFVRIDMTVAWEVLIARRGKIEYDDAQDAVMAEYCKLSHALFPLGIFTVLPGHDPVANVTMKDIVLHHNTRLPNKTSETSASVSTSMHWKQLVLRNVSNARALVQVTRDAGDVVFTNGRVVAGSALMAHWAEGKSYKELKRNHQRICDCGAWRPSRSIYGPATIVLEVGEECLCFVAQNRAVARKETGEDDIAQILAFADPSSLFELVEADNEYNMPLYIVNAQRTSSQVTI